MRILKFLKHHLWLRWRIPKGDYCYTIKRQSSPTDKGMPVIYTKVCPYWEEVDDVDGAEGFCTHLHLESPLIWDQCKECGINEFNDEGV